MWITQALAGLRFLTAFLLCLLLLGPVLSLINTEVEKPIVVLGLDNSASIKANMPGEELATYQKDLKTLVQNLEEKYRVRTYLIGEDVRLGRLSRFH